MAKELLIVKALALMALAGTASACVFYPTVSGGDGCGMAFDEKYRNETAVLGTIGNSGCALTSDETTILKDFVINGYSVERQDDEGYRAFLQEAVDANAARPAGCQDYLAVARNGGWTGYVRSGRGYENGQCITYRCSGPVAQILWNDLVAAPPGGNGGNGGNGSNGGNTSQNNTSAGDGAVSAPPAWIAYLIVAVVMTGLFLYMLGMRKK